jgi:hypothetical protein
MKPKALPVRRYSLALIGIIIWTTLILGLYYWVHKPLTPSLARALGGAVLDLGVACWFACLGGGLGHRFLRTLDLSVLNVPERLAIAGLLGMATLSLLIFIVGIVSLTTLSMGSLLGLVTWLVRHDMVSWIGDLGNWVRCGLPRNRWLRFLAVAALSMIVMALILATLPATKWDVLTYHLAGPQQYVEHGRFWAVPHNHFLGFPQLVDTLYVGQLALTGRLAGSALLHWLMGVFSLGVAGGYALRRSGPAAGWITVNVLLAATTIWLEMTFAYADLMPLGLATVALVLVDYWATVLQPSLEGHHSTATGASVHPWLMGFIAGLGMSSKYSVLWLGVALAGLIFWIGLRRGGWRLAIVSCGGYGIAAMLTLSPWLIRNAVWYGNPVYPLIFESAEIDDIRLDWYSQPQSGLVYSNDAWQIPILPITATFLGVESQGAYAADIGPLFLIATPFVFLVWNQFSGEEKNTVRFGLIIAGVITAAWWVTATFGSYVSLQTRLVLYLLGPLAVVAGMVFAALPRLPKKPVDISFVMRAMIVLIVSFTLIAAIRFFAYHRVELYFSGEDGYEQDYLENRLGWHYETMQQVNRLPEGSTVRFLWEPRYLYCDNVQLDCWPDSLMDAWYYARRTISRGDLAAIATRWKSAGVDYLLLYEFGRDYEEHNSRLYDDADWTAWTAFVAEYLHEIWRNGNTEDDIQYVLYTWAD